MVGLKDDTIGRNEIIMAKHNNVTDFEILSLNLRLSYGPIGLERHSPDFVLINFAITAVPSQVCDQFKENAHQYNPGNWNDTRQRAVGRDLRYRLQYRIAYEERV